MTPMVDLGESQKELRRRVAPSIYQQSQLNGTPAPKISQKRANNQAAYSSWYEPPIPAPLIYSRELLGLASVREDVPNLQET